MFESDNKTMYIIIAVCIMIFFIMRWSSVKAEGFLTYPKRRHAKLNDMGGIDYVSTRPPKCRGEYSCGITACPDLFPEDVICWKCLERPTTNMDVWSNAYF